MFIFLCINSNRKQLRENLQKFRKIFVSIYLFCGTFKSCFLNTGMLVTNVKSVIFGNQHQRTVEENIMKLAWWKHMVYINIISCTLLPWIQKKTFTENISCSAQYMLWHMHMTDLYLFSQSPHLHIGNYVDKHSL